MDKGDGKLLMGNGLDNARSMNEAKGSSRGKGKKRPMNKAKRASLSLRTIAPHLTKTPGRRWKRAMRMRDAGFGAPAGTRTAV